MAHRYDVDLVRSPLGGGTLTSPGKPPLVGGAPSDFGGSDEVWSPEHLLVSATALCFQTTFDFFARRAALPVTEMRCHAEGTVDKTRAGLAFTGLRLDVRLVVPAGQGARAHELLGKAKRGCLVSNSLVPIVELVPDVIEREAEFAAPAAP